MYLIYSNIWKIIVTYKEGIMKELSRYRVGKETDYLIVDTDLIGNTRVVANNSVFNISECYQGGSTLYDRGLNKQLDMVEVKNTLCVIEKELVLGINQYFLQDRKANRLIE